MFYTERTPVVNTHVARGVEMTPDMRDTLRTIHQEIKELGGGKSFQPRTNLGVTVFWWNSFASMNRGKDLTPVQRLMSQWLPPSAGRSIEVELGDAMLFPNAIKKHVGYEVHSDTLADENQALHEAIADLDFRVPSAGRLHVSIGNFAIRDLDRYNREDAEDLGPHVYAARLANWYRDQLPPALQLGRLSIAHNFQTA